MILCDTPSSYLEAREKPYKFQRSMALQNPDCRLHASKNGDQINLYSAKVAGV